MAGQRRAVARPPLLEVQLASPSSSSASATRTYVSTSVVGRGNAVARPSGQRAAGGSTTSRRRRALAQPRAAGEVRAEVEVAEREPRPPDAPLAELGGHPFGLAGAAPAALGVVRARRARTDRVEVGHQANAGQPQVVAGVHDHGHRCLGAAVPVGPPSRALLANAAHEARTTHPAGKHRDPHPTSLGGTTLTPAAAASTPHAGLPAALPRPARRTAGRAPGRVSRSSSLGRVRVCWTSDERRCGAST